LPRGAGSLLIASLATGLFYYSLTLLTAPTKALIATAAFVTACLICRFAFGRRTAFAMAATVLGLTMLFSAIIVFTIARFYGLW
jgi:hypothetical protein